MKTTTRCAMRSVRVSAVTLCLFMAAQFAWASDQIPGRSQDHPIALVGATIHPVTGPAIENGTILFVGGKIAAVGSDVTLPSGTERIDAAGKHVYPSLITAKSELGLTEIEAVAVTQDLAESGDMNPSTRVEAAVNPDSELLPVARANGVLLAHVVPGGQLIGGTSAVMMMDGWTWESMTLKAPTGLYIRWPRVDSGRGGRAGRGGRVGRGRRGEPPGREAGRGNSPEVSDLQKIRNAFADARAYFKAKEAETSDGIPFHASDIRWEAMGPVLKKEVPVLVHATGLKEIYSAVEWASEEDVRIVLISGQDVYYAAELLKEKHIPVIFERTLTTPSRRDEAYDLPFTAPRKLYETGVEFCIAGDDGASKDRNLPYHAAMAAAYGLPHEEALKAITINPARILGIGDRVGSLEIGKDATLIVSNGDPLEITSNVEMAFIQGRKVDLTSRHTELWEKYKIKYEQLGPLIKRILDGEFR